MIRYGLALVLSVLVIAGLTSSILIAKEVRAEARLRLSGQAETMVISLEDRLQQGGTLTREDVERLAPKDTEVVLRYADGRVAARTGPVLAAEVMSVTVEGPVGMSATVSTDSAPVDRRVHRAWNLIIAIAAAIAAVAALGALFQARQLTRPLDRLARAAAQLGAGEAGVVVPRSGLTEVDAIAVALEDSGQRVAELMAAERQFSANASHQLRSPLTAIAISLELIADSDDPAVQREAAEALEQVAGLDDRINELLRLARTGRAAAAEPTDLTALIGRQVDVLAAQFHRGGRRITLVAPDRVEANVTPGALTQAVEILIDNALVHGSGDVEVRIVQVGREEIDIAICDEGQLTKTSVGSQAGAGPSTDRRSHGLGLLLARNLLRGDGGRVDLESAAPTTFVIRLPLGPRDGRRGSRAHLLAHEDGVRRGEQDDDDPHQRGHLPPGQDEALGQGEGARQ
jgi:signal transduction histidine kinase